MDAATADSVWQQTTQAIGRYDFAEANKRLTEALSRLDGSARIPFLAQQGRVLGPMGRQAEAVEAVREAVDLLETPGTEGDAATWHGLGLTLCNARREAEALPLLKRAAELAPHSGPYWKTRGETEDFLGLTDEAERSYDVAARTGNWAAHLALARLKRWTREHNHIDRLINAPVRTALHQACQGYALFKEYDDIDDRANAWRWLQKGAAAARSQPVTPNRPPWSAAAESTTTDVWIAAFPPERSAHVPAIRRSAPRRIFIIGLPRSGTTLVERILGAHSQVQALGELPTFPAAVKTCSGSQTPALIDAETIKAAAHIDPQAIADFYDREIAWRHDGSPCVTDKLPHNSDYAGLIRLAFPDAVIIHVRRAPMDALFGAYKLYFAAGWSFDQNDLAEHYRNYSHLMAHWKTCLGDGLIDISLEALIRDPDMEIRRLLDACDLPFETDCLRPHNAKGAVASASSSQVRQPINAEGIGAWRRYEKELAPLRGRLQSMGVVDSNGDTLS
ncbi:tetratricopeptide repeat-containing sulfotransferase family protein [Asticcacaulis sp.]|uniref:tetratricopeptide repeat-containing sulfotransferase family protein n=1 Tax=Asticcacaulis sp. TaxID=1872648 RepID=UPI003F7C2FBD